MIQSKITSKGQTTLPKAVREVLGVAGGDSVRYVVCDAGFVKIIPSRSLSRLFGICQHDGPPVSLEDMEQAIADGVSGE